MAPYPNSSEVHNHFTHLASDTSAFFARVHPNVNWTIMGTSPMSRQYSGLKDFQDSTLGVLAGIMKPPGLQIRVANVTGGGESEWACAELFANAMCKNGKSYNMTYCWVMRFDKDGMIDMVRAYLDTRLLSETLQENLEGEVKSSVTVPKARGEGVEYVAEKIVD